MNIYIHLTPEQALELALKLQRVARDVNDAIVNRELPDAHEYIPIGKVENGLIANVRMRIGK